jgi:hypothetical protein
VVVRPVIVAVPVDVRTCVVSTVEVDVDGPIVTVVGTTTVLVDVSVPMKLVTVVVRIDVRYCTL